MGSRRSGEGGVHCGYYDIGTAAARKISGAGFLFSASSLQTTASQLSGGKPIWRKFASILTRSAPGRHRDAQSGLAASLNHLAGAGERPKLFWSQFEINLIGPRFGGGKIERKMMFLRHATDVPVL